MRQERDYLKGFRKFAVPGPSDEAGIDDMRQYLVEVVEAANDHAGCAARYAHHSRDAEVALLAREVKELERLAVKAAELKTAAVVKDSRIVELERGLRDAVNALKTAIPVVGHLEREKRSAKLRAVIREAREEFPMVEQEGFTIIHVWAAGDDSVGTPDYDERFALSLPAMVRDLEERERVREIFQEAFTNLVGDKAIVTFGDECRSCRAIGGHKPGCVDAPKVINRRDLGRDAMESELFIPPDMIYVGRPTKWGNKFLVNDPLLPSGLSKAEKHRMVVDEYRKWIKTQPELLAALDELRGMDLICWCSPLPCHADVLLELANGPQTCGLVIDDCQKVKRVVDQDIEDEQKAAGIREACEKCRLMER